MQKVEPFPTNREAKIQLDGMEIRLASPREAIESHLAFQSNDREIYQPANQWMAQGIANLLITSEMIELSILGNRVAVMHHGQVMAEFSQNQAAKRFC